MLPLMLIQYHWQTEVIKLAIQLLLSAAAASAAPFYSQLLLALLLSDDAAPHDAAPHDAVRQIMMLLPMVITTELPLATTEQTNGQHALARALFWCTYAMRLVVSMGTGMPIIVA